MKKIRDALESAQKGRKRAQDGLVCKQGEYAECVVLKMLKPSWTNDDMDETKNSSGVFFSIWVELADPSRLKYNIHALKMRQLRDHAVTSRDFAAEFRKRFASSRAAWPNVSVDYGPLTLMEGWMELDERTFERDVANLMSRFEAIAPIIDELLAQRAVRK